jgi:hypothetical protein
MQGDNNLSETSFFEEQAAVEVGEKISELIEKWSIDIETLAIKCGVSSEELKASIQNGELTVRELAKVLYHMNYRMLFTTKPMSSADRQQGDNWLSHE